MEIPGTSSLEFRTLFETAAGRCVVLLPDAPRYTILAVTEAFLAAGMTTREALVGRGMFEVFPDNPDDPKATGAANLSASIARAIETRASDLMPVQRYDVRRPDGQFEVRFWSATNAPLLDAAGAVSCIVHQVVDVTEFFGDERNHAELEARSHAVEAELFRKAQALRDTNEQLQAANQRLVALGESQFRALFDFMPQLGWTALPDGFIDFYNRRWYEYTGTTYEEMKGWGWKSVHDPALLPAVTERWQHALATGTPFEMEFPLRRADGELRWFLTRVLPMRDGSGRITRWVGINTDIDDRRRAGMAAEQSEQRLQILADASAILSSSLDYETTLQGLAAILVPAHADWCAVTLLENGQLVPVAVAHVDPSKVELARELQRRWPARLDDTTGVANILRTGKSELYPQITDELLAAVITDPERLQVMRELKLRSSMSVPLSARSTVIGALTLIWAESSRTYGPEDVPLIEELARRAALAVDNARLYREAQEAVRLRDEFLSIASHELKTPLTTIVLHITAILRGLRKPDAPALDKLAARLSIVDQHIHRLTALIEELLDVARATSGRLKIDRTETDLSAVVRDAAQRLRPNFAAAGSELVVEVSGPERGMWDPARLDQVITNLLTNALKYGAGKPVTVALKREDNRVLIVVEDHGIGIASADQRRIFERFARAVPAQNYGGLGLGLWISKELVEAMGGSIVVESEPGRGSRFTVALPT